MDKLLSLLHYFGGHGAQNSANSVNSSSNEVESGSGSPIPAVDIKISQGLTSYVNPGEVVRIQKERARLMSARKGAASPEDSPAPVNLSG